MWAGRAESVIAGWLRWLRGDIRDVVQVVPRQRAQPRVQADRVDLAAGLHRWGGQLTRRRAIAVTRRWLLIALPVALIPAIVVLALGGSRPFWLIAALTPALVSGAVALTRRVPVAQAARLLDRTLGLHDQLGTALELRAGAGRIPAVGLAAMVLEDANLAVRESMTTARVASRHAAVEWAWVGVGACALALVIALPRHGAAGRAQALRPNSGLTGGAGATGGRRTATHPAAPGHPSRVVSAGLPKGIAPTRWAGAPGTANPHARVTVTPPAGTPGHRGSTGLSVASGPGAVNSAKLGGVGGAGRAGADTDGAHAGAGTAAHASSPSRTGARAVRGASAAKAAPGAASSPRTRGTPGGATAGTGRATVSHRLGVIPTLGGSKQLPLEAGGSTPAASGRTSAPHGQSETPNGGGGSGGRGGRAGAGSPAGTDFAPIPATSNAPDAADEDLLQSFFGTTDQLSFTGW